MQRPRGVGDAAGLTASPAKQRVMQCRHGRPSACTDVHDGARMHEALGVASENSVTHGTPAACA
jgi:hypothetical protein